MSPQVEDKQTSDSLEQEFAQLQDDERALKDRLEKGQVAMAVGVVFAVVASAVALTLALTKSTDTNTVVMRGPGASSSQRLGRSAMGPGMMNRGASTNGVATSRTISVGLGEMYVRPSASSISAGKVTFVAHNNGQVIHELMVERAPIKMDGPGRPNEEAALGMIEDMRPGTSGRMTLKLKPGTYVLFCNVTGHYAAGQHTTLTVTKS